MSGARTGATTDVGSARTVATHSWIRPTGEVMTPIIVWAASAWVGALVGWAAAPPMAPRGVAGGLAVGGCMLAALARVAHGRARGSMVRVRAGTSALATVVAATVVMGTVAGLAYTRSVSMDRGPLARVAREGGTVAIDAEVASEPVVRPDGTSWVLLTVLAVDGDPGRWGAVVGGLPAGPDPLVVGARVAATTTARPLGHDGFDGALRRRHVGVRLDPVTWRVVAPPRGLLAHVEAVRADIRTAAGAGLSDDAAALAVGLVTGDTRDLSQAAADGMRATGLTHLVAVSGSNVALVLAVVALLTGALPAGWRRAAMALAVVVFTITTRVEPSVLRAGVMAGMVLVTRARGVPGSALHALAATMFVLLLADPAAAGRLGLVLSALATAGVLLIAPTVVRRLGARTPRAAAGVLAATLGAQVAVAPVLVATVGEVPLVSVPANLVAVPAAAIASLVAVVAAVIAPLHTGLAALVFRGADLPLQVVLGVAAWSPGPVLSWAQPVALAVATLSVASVLAPRGSPVRRGGLVLVATIVLAMGGGRLATSRSPGGPPSTALAVTAIDVGQGDAVLVTTASGHRMLVDVGGDDAAARWLRRHGVDDVDLVVLTHGHADHVGGLPAVLAVTEVATIWLASGPRTPDGLPLRVPTAGGPVAVPTTSATVVEVRAGMTARLGSARVEVLAPPPGWALVGTDGGLNDQSVVVRVVEDDRVALLTGDVEVAGQRWLAAHAGDLRASLLKVPHHGAATTDPGFLAAVAPRVAIVSVGADNDYGHPAPDVLRWLADLGAEVHRTDRDGTVHLEVPALRADATTASRPARSLRHHGHPPVARRRRPPAPPGDHRPGGRPARRRRRAVVRGPRRGRTGPPAVPADHLALR